MNRTILIIGGVVVVLMLAGATFVAARFLNRPEETAGGGSGREVMISQSEGGGPVQFNLDIEPAPELPATPPEAAGLFVRREDNSIFVGTGDIEVNVSVDETGKQSTKTDFSGPVLEVVVTRDTVIYRDETDFPSPSEASGDVSVQQVVQPVDSPDELGDNNPNTEVQVWGSRSGDRVVAEVLVYRLLGR